MSLRYSEDLASVSITKPTGLEGVESLIRFTKDGNAEIQNIMKNECDVILECRFCRSLFRSAPNFLAHKRAFCRGLHHVAVAHAKALKKAVEEEAESLAAEKEQVKKMEKSGLKRTNIVGALNKRGTDIEIEVPDCKKPLILHTLPRVSKEVPITIFENGVQKVVESSFPNGISKGIPEDRIVVVMPQDTASKYREMQLRKRDAGSKQEVSRVYSPADLSIMEKCQSLRPGLTDVATLQCLHPDCTNIRSFGSVSALSYHIGVKHPVRSSGDRWCCLLCKFTLKTWPSYCAHLTRIHSKIKEDHLAYRSKEVDPDRRRQGKRTAPRYRSLSPAEECPLDAVLKQEDTDSPPVIQPVSDIIDETSNDDEGPPSLPKMSTRSRKENRPTKRISIVSSAVEETDEKDLSKASDDSGISQDTRNVQVKEKEPQETEVERKQTSEEKNIKRSLSYIVDQISEGNLDVKMCDISSREPSSIPSESLGHTRESSQETECSDDRNERSPSIPKLESEEVDKSEVSSSQTSKETENISEQCSSDSDADQVVYSRNPEVRKTTPKKDGNSSDDDMDGSAASRPSRNRKRPEWMESFVMDGQSDATASPEQPFRYVLPTKKRTVIRRSSNTPDPAITYTSTGIEFNRNLDISGFTIPRKRKIENEAPEAARTSPVKRYVNTGPPVLNKEGKFDRDHHSPGPSQNRAEQELYTPRARKINFGEPIPTASSNPRRKQNLAGMDVDDDLRILSSNGKAEYPSGDLATVPVFLSQAQKEMFFSPLKPYTGDPDNITGMDASSAERDPGNSGPYQCEHCKIVVPNLKEGRRHMVSHIRVMRLRCKLCTAGAFFCTDMRAHLMERCCSMLHEAPPGAVTDGSPCMTKEWADRLTEVVDRVHPGRVAYTSGQIVSSINKCPYFPDPVIEERILGNRCITGKSSPIKKLSNNRYQQY